VAKQVTAAAPLDSETQTWFFISTAVAMATTFP